MLHFTFNMNDPKGKRRMLMALAMVAVGLMVWVLFSSCDSQQPVDTGDVVAVEPETAGMMDPQSEPCAPCAVSCLTDAQLEHMLEMCEDSTDMPQCMRLQILHCMQEACMQ